jgi:hypothetical protein
VTVTVTVGAGVADAGGGEGGSVAVAVGVGDGVTVSGVVPLNPSVKGIPAPSDVADKNESDNDPNHITSPLREW